MAPTVDEKIQPVIVPAALARILAAAGQPLAPLASGGAPSTFSDLTPPLKSLAKRRKDVEDEDELDDEEEEEDDLDDEDDDEDEFDDEDEEFEDEFEDDELDDDDDIFYDDEDDE